MSHKRINKKAAIAIAADRKGYSETINEYISDMLVNIKSIERKLNGFSYAKPLPTFCSGEAFNRASSIIEEANALISELDSCRDRYNSDIVFDGIVVEDYCNNCMANSPCSLIKTKQEDDQ